MKATKPIQRVNRYFLVIILISIFAPMALSNLFAKLNLSMPVNLILTHFLFFIIPAILYILITKQSFKEVLRLNKIGIKEVIIAIAIAFLAQPVMSFFAYIASFFFTNDVSVMLETLNSAPLWLMVLMIGVTPAISEEITVRGIILSGFNFKNKHVAAVMSGLMFGILHMNPHQFMYAFVMGVIFAYMVRAANSIYVSMIAHFTINTTQLLLQRILLKAQEQLPAAETQTQTAEAMEMLNSISLGVKLTSIVVFGGIVLIIVFIIMKLLKVLEESRKKRVRLELEKNTRDGVVSIQKIESVLGTSHNNIYERKYGFSREELEKEKIITISFIASIIIFIWFMIKIIM